MFIHDDWYVSKGVSYCRRTARKDYLLGLDKVFDTHLVNEGDTIPDSDEKLTANFLINGEWNIVKSKAEIAVIENLTVCYMLAMEETDLKHRRNYVADLDSFFRSRFLGSNDG